MARSVKDIYRSVVDERARDSLWALRTRRDPSVLSGVIRGMLGVSRRVGSTEEHLVATMGWLCAAQDATQDGGVSAFYDVRAGQWGPPYPETTGYIIPTFYDYARHTGDESYRLRARRMADWLLGLQLERGAFPIGPLWPEWDRRPIVFDTGQIIHGLVRAYEETRTESYLESAGRAGDWLCEIQESDGSWRKFTSSGSVHTYNVRTAWALLRLNQVTGHARHRQGAVRNLEWAVNHQAADGWFPHMEFKAGENPLTHTIAYTIEGILESSVILSDASFMKAARLAADAVAADQRAHGYLGGRYSSGWSRAASWSCLTGNAQMGLVWFRLYELTQRGEYLEAAVSANRHVKQRQVRKSALSGVAGGIGGSDPIYQEYEPYRHLNWAAKFFVDSLLLEQRCESGSQANASPLRQQSS